MSADPRLLLVAEDAASLDLEGVVRAPAYRPAALMRAAASRAAVRRAPGLGSEQVDELVFGEGFKALEVRDGFAFGQALRDGYVGWVEAALLSDGLPEPTHRVSALSSFAFTEPSIKAPVAHTLAMNALVSAAAEEGRFVKLDGSGWIVRRHLSDIGRFEIDPAGAALRFLGAPYLWGGRTAAGLDCSGLVQQALYACGVACPRDSDQQASLGRPLEVDADLAGLERNDLVFWPGHVGVMLDGQSLLHANAEAMCVSSEPLNEAVRRISAAGSGAPSAFRRL